MSIHFTHFKSRLPKILNAQKLSINPILYNCLIKSKPIKNKFKQMYKIIRSLKFNSAIYALNRNVTQRPISNNVTKPSSESNPDEPVNITNPFEKERQQCILCKLNITPNHKNVKLLSQFQSPYTGQIYGRHITGLCKRKQEEVEKAIIRAQNCAMMPTYHKDLNFLKDPKLFNAEKPIRPHKY